MEKEREGERERKIYIYFKELAHEIVRADRSEICRLDWQAGGPEKS